jgi:hypothetical protein
MSPSGQYQQQALPGPYPSGGYQDCNLAELLGILKTDETGTGEDCLS